MPNMYAVKSAKRKYPFSVFLNLEIISENMHNYKSKSCKYDKYYFFFKRIQKNIIFAENKEKQ